MDARTSTLLIEAAGGDLAFARLIGLSEQKNFQQRVNNWKRRGIPSQVHLDHLDVIEPILQSLPATDKAAA